MIEFVIYFAIGKFRKIGSKDRLFFAFVLPAAFCVCFLPAFCPFSRLPAGVKIKIRNQLFDHDAADSLTAFECVDYYLKWEGMIGYTGTIVATVLNAYGFDSVPEIGR